MLSIQMTDISYIHFNIVKGEKMAGKNQSSKKDHTIFDQKCITCGTWMKTTEEKSKKGAVITTYSCPECGLSYSVGED